MANIHDIKTESGSSLIAMSILIIVIGTMTTGFLFIYGNKQKLQKEQETVKKNEVILAAINDYLMRNGRLPCPAPLNARRDTRFFGIEDPNRDCDQGSYYNRPGANFSTASGPGGNTSSPSRNIVRVAPLPPGNGANQRPDTTLPACPIAAPNDPGCPGFVKIGTLPTRNLGLTDDYMVDGYGKRYIYAVTERLASPNFNPNANLGAVDITDSAGNSLSRQRAHIKYIFFSPGIDDRGAYDIDGGRIQPCNRAVLAGENCDFQFAAFADATFLSSFFKQDN